MHNLLFNLATITNASRLIWFSIRMTLSKVDFSSKAKLLVSEILILFTFILFFRLLKHSNYKNSEVYWNFRTRKEWATTYWIWFSTKRTRLPSTCLVRRLFSILAWLHFQNTDPQNSYWFLRSHSNFVDPRGPGSYFSKQEVRVWQQEGHPRWNTYRIP